MDVPNVIENPMLTHKIEPIMSPNKICIIILKVFLPINRIFFNIKFILN
jgi:hypothetical protein